MARGQSSSRIAKALGYANLQHSLLCSGKEMASPDQSIQRMLVVKEDVSQKQYDRRFPQKRAQNDKVVAISRDLQVPVG